MEDNNYLIEKKIEYLIDMKVNKIKNELNSAMNKIAQMTEEIEVLKNKVTRLNSEAVQPKQAKLIIEEQIEQQVVPKQARAVQQATREFNQRTGDFKPEDVSIEKMFYFGSK